MEKMPIYVKIEKYEDVLDVISLIKDKMASIKETFGKIESLKAAENAKLDEWRKNIGEIEGRIVNIDRILYEPEA